MPVMLTLSLTKRKEDQAHMFLCIYCRSFQIHQPIVVHHSVHIDHDTFLCFFYFEIFPDSFCMSAASIYDIFHCWTTVKFFLVWQRRFIESLPTIHALIWRRLSTTSNKVC